MASKLAAGRCHRRLSSGEGRASGSRAAGPEPAGDRRHRCRRARVTGSEIATTITDPVHSWLIQHSAGLPLTAEQLWWFWIISGPVFWLLAIAGTTGGRAGWVLLGAATTAMVYAGAAPPSSGTAAAVGAGAWALLSVPALRRIKHAPVIVAMPGPSTSGQAKASTPADHRSPDLPALDDGPAIAADLYERLLRRQIIRLRDGTSPLAGHGPGWMVTAGPGQGFRAVDEHGRQAAGLAISAEAIPEILRELAPHAAGTPAIRWDGLPPSPPSGWKARWEESKPLEMSMSDFIDTSPDELAQLSEFLLEARRSWIPSDQDLDGRIAQRAAELDFSHPLIVADIHQPSTGSLGQAAAYAWVDPATVIETGSRTEWNGFANHRPQQVSRIVGHLLGETDPAAAIRFHFADGAIVKLTRIAGPAGPVHVVAENGLHRTHAARILGAPFMAAQVYLDPVPLYADEDDLHTSAQSWTGENIAELWEGLLRRRLVSGSVSHRDGQARLDIRHTNSPWLLLDADRATCIARAYSNVYPESLARIGIPASAIAGPAAWRLWLTS